MEVLNNPLQLWSSRVWKPSKEISQGAIAYHKAVAKAPYYIENLQEFSKMVESHLHDNDVVIDFGAGTGVSAIQLLKNAHKKYHLWLIDNSAAWLTKAYDLFKKYPSVKCFLLNKKENSYEQLSEVVGNEIANEVVSANTVHLIHDLDATFKGIYDTLQPDGTFIFQSGNILRKDKEKDILLIDDTVRKIHDIAIDLIQRTDKYKECQKDIEDKVRKTAMQRSFVFPEPRQLESYTTALKNSGFSKVKYHHKHIKVRYKDWMKFVRVKRLQAGILPEVGGLTPNKKEANRRDKIIKKATKILFKDLRENNKYSDSKGYTIESVFVQAAKGA